MLQNSTGKDKKIGNGKNGYNTQFIPKFTLLIIHIN